MRRFTTLLVLLTCLCAACGPDAGQADAVRLWTGLDAEFPVIQKVVADFQRQTGLRVEMLKVPFEQLRNKFLIAAPAGLGPDLVIGPQDWVGVLATAEQLEPLPEEVLPGPTSCPSRFRPSSSRAGSTRCPSSWSATPCSATPT